MHEYTVEFRISGVELVPATITQALGLAPSLVREVGEHKAEGKVWDKGLWSFNGLPDNTQKAWSSLEDGLNFLFDKLEPVRNQIHSARQNYDLVIWCGHFQSGFDGGPTLSAGLLRRLADFGVDLYIDNYFAESDRSKRN